MSYFYKTLDYITHISADIFHLLQFFPALGKMESKEALIKYSCCEKMNFHGSLSSRGRFKSLSITLHISQRNSLLVAP